MSPPRRRTLTKTVDVEIEIDDVLTQMSDQALRDECAPPDNSDAKRPRLDPQVIADVLVSRGSISSGALASRHGITRNAVIGYWHRRESLSRRPEVADAIALRSAAIDAAPPEAAPLKPVRAAAHHPSAGRARPAHGAPDSRPSAEPHRREAIIVLPVVPIIAAIVEPRSPMAVRWTGAAAAMLAHGHALCAFPIGDARDEDFRFCGAPIADPYKPNGKLRPYCTACRKIAYVVKPPVFRPRAFAGATA